MAKKPIESIQKVFMNDTKIGYGKSDIFYLLDDLCRITGDLENSKKYTSLLEKHSATKTKVVSWEKCIKTLSKKLEKHKFDVTISIGRVGNLISQDLEKLGINLGKTTTFYVTRLSNYRWRKIAYINTPGQPSLNDQASEIKNMIKNAEHIAIIDDVTYSGGTRKVLEKIIGLNKKVTAIDLITIKKAQEINKYYDNWISGVHLKHDPYPTTNSSNQADIMNVSEFIYPSKNIGKIISGSTDCNKVLWDGNCKIFKKCAYTANKERNTVYFGEHGKHVHKETKKFQVMMPPLF